MIERKTFPVDEHREIAVTVEKMSDGTWAVVSSVKEIHDDAERVVDLPVPSETFPTEADAEAYGVRLAREWIDANMPRAA
jgi:hypothetical protein